MPLTVRTAAAPGKVEGKVEAALLFFHDPAPASRPPTWNIKALTPPSRQEAGRAIMPCRRGGLELGS